MNEAKQLDDVFSDLMSTNTTEQPPIEDVNGQDLGELFETPHDPLSSEPKTNTSKETEDDNEVVVSESDSNVETKSNDDDSEDVSWDDYVDAKNVEEETKSPINWLEVGKALNISDEVKSQEDVAKYVSTLKSTIDELKAKPTLDDTIPVELREALEIAKSNGDYLSYLDVASVDYSQIDPIEIFEDEAAELFYNQDGTFRQVEYDDYLDGLSETDKLLRGKQIQRELVAIQNEQKHQIKQRAAYQKADSLKKLERTLDNFEKVGDYKVTPKVKKQMYTELASGDFTKLLGINDSGNHNWEVLLGNYFKARYFDAIDNYNRKGAKTETLRSVTKDLTNSTVTRNNKVDNPTETREKKISGVDLYLQRFSSQI